jgi:hypothetical protein
MSIEDLKKIGYLLFKKNDVKSNKDRTLINAQWASIGRGSDVGSISFNDIHWMDSFFIGDVTRRKIAKQHSLAVFPSALIWQIDLLHCLGVQIITDPYCASMKIFSQTAGHGSNELKIAAYINRLIKVYLLLIIVINIIVINIW